jgi:hypothetical protein
LVETSLDGDAWTEIDRKTDARGSGSFTISKLVECRSIRENPAQTNELSLRGLQNAPFMI